MADVELVIKIPEEMYKWVNDANKFFNDYGMSDFIDLVKNGLPLPKGHGRLIDVSEYFRSYYHDAREFLDNAHTIIEADKTESDDVG